MVKQFKMIYEVPSNPIVIRVYNTLSLIFTLNQETLKYKGEKGTTGVPRMIYNHETSVSLSCIPLSLTPRALSRQPSFSSSAGVNIVVTTDPAKP